MFGMKNNWADIVKQQTSSAAQPPKTPYQQNVSQPVQQSVPTTRQALGQIYLATQQNQQNGMQLQNNFIALQNDPGSIYYAPYSKQTNKAVSLLNEYGIQNVNKDWYDQTQFLDRYLNYNGQTNTPSAPGKKSSLMENIAYQRYQYGKGMELTDKAKQECEALKEEINYLTGWADRNYSDDQIVEYLYGADGSKFAKKYPTLAAMDNSMNPGQTLLELNEAIPYSKDWVYGNIWAARNNGGSGNMYTDMAMSALGRGNQWQENPDITARLDQNNPDTYAPYTVGSTTDDVCMYLGVPSYDKDYLMAHRPDPNDQTSVNIWNKGWDAATFTDDANAELEKFNKRLESRLQNATNPEDVMKAVDGWLQNDYSNLNKLDKSTEKINSLVDTSSKIDFSRNDIIRKVNERCAENAARLNGGDTLAKNGVNVGTDQSYEATKAGDQKVVEAANIVKDPTEAEQNVLNNTPSSWFDRVRQSFQNIENPLALAKRNESETVTNYANTTITAVNDIMSNMKATEQLDALNRTNENRVNRCDEIRDGFSSGTGMFSFMYDIEDGPTVKRGDADVANSRYAPALVELYETVTGESAVDEDGGIRPGVIEEAKKYYDYIVNGSRTYEEDEEIPWLLDNYTETKQNLEAEIDRTKGANQKHKWSSLMMNARIAAYEAAGMDATGLKTGQAVANSLYFFMEYDATNWNTMNRYEAMVQGIKDGETYETVKAEAIEGNKQIQEELENCLFIKDYLAENNISVPDNVRTNLDRHIAKLQRDQQDFEYFILRDNADFADKVEEGKKLEEADYEQRIRDNPDEASEYADAAYGLESAEFYDLMTDAEKDTYYYIYATEGQDAAIRYVASYLSDNTYGVLQTRYREKLQKQAEEEVNSGILGAAWANTKAIISAPLSGVNSLTYTLGTLITGEEFNPNNKALAMGQYANAVNAETMKALNDPENIKSPFLRDLASGAYEIGYNRLRSMANAAAFGGVLGDLTSSAILNEIFAALPMASDAMGTAIANAKDKGAEDWQAYAIGGVTLLAESVTEGLTYGNIKEAFTGSEDQVARSVKDLLKTWLTSSGVEEMIGESANDIIENIADETILGALSEHTALVNKYIEDLKLDPNNPVDRDKAEELARKDELNGVLHTALISYLSPGLDMFTSGITDSVRDFQNIRVATSNLQKQGFNVSMSDVRKDYMKMKENEIQNAQNAPAQTEQVKQEEQTQQAETQQAAEENPNFTTEDVDADALFGQNNKVSEEETSVAAPEAKQPSTADLEFLSDLSKLDAVQNSDTSTQAGAIGALFGGQTDTQIDTAKAAAAGITKLFGSMQNAVSEIKNIMTGAHIAFVSQQMVKEAIKTATLSTSSEAFNIMQTEEYKNASPIERASMLASTVEADQANADVQGEIDKATYENRVAEAEGELIRNGALDSIKDLKANLEKAQQNVQMAQESLEEKQAEVQAKSDALDAAVKESVDNPTPENMNAVTKAAGELEKADAVQQEYEQHLDNINRANADAQTKYDDAYNSVMRDIRQQAEAVIADQNQQRAERDAQIAQQQQAAAEQAAQEQAKEDQRSGKQAEVDTQAKAQEWADQQHLEGQERDDFIQRVMDRQEQLTLGEIDMTGKLTNAEGYLAIMAFGRKTGLQFQLSDTLPAGTRGMYKDGVVYLNNNLVKDGSMTVGQALVEAALHEIPHSMEQTKNYQAYRSAALGYLYGYGKKFNYAAYDAAIDTKINDYKKIGQNLTKEQAEAEIVADFARTHLADKEVVQRFMDAGLGGKMRNTLHNINQALKNFFGRMTGEERQMAEYLRKAERAYQKAMNELAKTEIHPEGGQFSVAQIAQSMNLGMAYNEDTLQLFMPDPNGDIVGDGNNGTVKGQRYFEIDGVEHRIEPDMIVNTPVGMLIDMGLSDEVFKDANGNEHTQKGDARKMFADLMNLCARYKDNNLVWEIAGSEFAETFSALKSNSDPQYKNTVDFGTICAKTQAIVDVLSQTMLKRIETIRNWNEAHAEEIKAGTAEERVFTGLNRDDIMMVYDQTHQANLTVPCPVCYVFSRWMGVPSLLGQMNRFQHEFVAVQKDENGKTVYDENGDAVIDWDATQELVNKYLYGDGETQGILQKYGSKDAIADKKTSLQGKIRSRTESLPELNKLLLEFQKEAAALEAKEELTKEEKKKLKSLKGKIATKEKAIAKNIREQDQFTEELREVESFNWVSQALCKQHTEKGGKVVNDLDENGHFIVDRENFRLTPEEILFDLNRTGEFAGYAKNWKYRTTRGAGMGKAIMPYSGASIGDIINGDAIRWKTDQNPFLNMDKEAAMKAFESAKERVRKQNLVGGQRFQSTSDFRPEWGLDYVMSFLEMQALGSKVQMYTKVAEAVDFLGSIGADVNLSIMASGNGFHEATAEEIEKAKTDKELASRMGTLDGKTYVMDFSDVTGMDYNTAKGKTKKFNNVQMILVGMNDIHIKLALGNEDIDFIIPWHSSGNSKDVLQQLVASVDETLTESSDYTDVQTDQIKSHKEGTGKNEKTIDDRTDLEIARWNARLKILTGVANKDVNLEKPNEGGFGTVTIDGKEMSERELVYGDKWLKQLYDRFYVEGVDPDCFGVKLPKAQAEQIFPYEYWDKSSTRENADVNGERFAEYCDLLGLVPRFSQFKDVPGYWKLLIDRKMYDNNILNDDGTVKEYGKYREQKVVDVTNARMDTDASQELDAAEKRKQDVYQLPESTTAKYGKNFSKEVQDAVYNANAILEQKYDVTGQASFYGDMTDADIDQALLDAMSGMSADEMIDFLDLDFNLESIQEWKANKESKKASAEETVLEIRDWLQANVDYMDAINRGDMAAADALVKAKAKDAGYTLYAVHRTNDEFDVFDKSYQSGTHGKSLGNAFYVADARSAAYDDDYYGKNRMRLFVNPGTVFDIQNDSLTEEQAKDIYNKYFAPLHPNAWEGYTDHVLEQLQNEFHVIDYIKEAADNGNTTTDEIFKELGYNSIKDGPQYAIFDPEQIKSADTVTYYDDKVTPVPLTERFNIQIPSIRFSAAGDMTDADIDQQLMKAGLVPKESTQNFSYKDALDAFGWTEKYEGARQNGYEDYEQVTGIYTKTGNKVGERYGNGIIFDSPGYGKSLFDNGMLKGGTYRGAVWTPGKNTNVRNSAVQQQNNETKPQTQTMAQRNQEEVAAGLAFPMEGLNPLMNPSVGEAQRKFASPEGMMNESDEMDARAKAIVMAQNGRAVDTNVDQINRAIKWIRSNKATPNSTGLYEGIQKVVNNDFDYMSVDGQARMVSLMGLAAAENDTVAQATLMSGFSGQGSDLGRAFQARKLWRLMTPEGRQYTLFQMLTNTEKELGAKGVNVNLKFSDWIYKAAAAATEEGDFKKVYDAAAAELAQQIPANWRDKFRAWRMLSMLGNPRTHVRNVVGNMLFIPAVGLKNKLGAIAEIMTGQEDRTKTLKLVLPKDVRDFARNDAKNIKDVLTGEAKYNEGSAVQRAMKPFKGLLQALIDLNGGALEKEDWIFLKGHYRRALGSWMTANGYTAEMLNENKSLLEQGREYAIEEAQKATYRDLNKLASTLNKVSRDGGVAGFLVDATLPFKKTPANILRRGLEYSPVGIMRSIATDIYHMKQWNDFKDGKLKVMPEKAVSPTQFIDRICSGLSGTLVMAVGALLGHAGLASCGLDDDDDKLEKAKGGQEYALNISKLLGAIGVPNLFGKDVTFTMDWAAPMSMPFFVGVAAQELFANQEGFEIDDLVDAFGNITEPVFNLSMLDGINSLFKTSQYDDTNTITQIGAKIGSNYVTSYWPSLFGAFARTFDEKQRKAFVKSGEGTGVLGTARYAIEQVQNKIPVLNYDNIAVRDIWGEEKTSGLVERILENFILPGYVNDYADDPILNEMSRLYEVTGDDSIIPQEDPNKSFSYKNQRYILDDKQWDQYKAVRNQTAHAALAELINTDEYQQAEDSAQIQMIKDVWSYADKVGKKSIVPEYEVEDKGPNPVDRIAKDSKIAWQKNEMIKALDDGDYEAYETMVQALRDAEVEDTSIKEKISTTYRDRYKAAYEKATYLTTPGTAEYEKAMMELHDIEELLDMTGFSFNIYGKDGWQAKVDETYYK